jgi:MFS family permease
VRATWRLLAAHRDLRFLLSAGLISLAGDWILRVGLAYRVYALTGSTIASALTIASSFLPQLLLGALGGVFADRWDRRRTMIVADLLLAAGLLPLLLVHGAGQVWLVFVVLVWEGMVAQFFTPAEQAVLPTLVPDEALVTANATGGQVQNLSRLAGSAVGGVIAAVAGTLGAGVLGQAVGIIPVLAFQGGGYVVAGLAMLIVLRAETRTADRPVADLIGSAEPAN